jgi:hypothetical protein
MHGQSSGHFSAQGLQAEKRETALVFGEGLWLDSRNLLWGVKAVKGAGGQTGLPVVALAKTRGRGKGGWGSHELIIIMSVALQAALPRFLS